MSLNHAFLWFSFLYFVPYITIIWCSLPHFPPYYHKNLCILFMLFLLLSLYLKNTSLTLNFLNVNIYYEFSTHLRDSEYYNSFLLSLCFYSPVFYFDLHFISPIYFSSFFFFFILSADLGVSTSFFYFIFFFHNFFLHFTPSIPIKNSLFHYFLNKDL